MELKLGAPAIVLLIALATTLVMIPAVYAAGHPDNCDACHYNTGGDTVNDMGGSRWNHTIYTSEAWTRCSFCHTGVADGVSRSVHSNIGCGCHTVVHTGRYYGLSPTKTGSWAAWGFAKVANITGGTPILAPTVTGPEDLLTKRFFWDETNGSDIRNWLPADTQEIEVGLTDPNGTLLTTDKYIVCFSCHFLTAEPGDLGAYKLVGGVWKIGIPEFALKLPPHEITSEMLAGYEGEGRGLPDIGWAIQPLALIGAGAVGLLLFRRR